MGTQRWWVAGERLAFLAVSGLILFGALHIQGVTTRHLVEAAVLGVTWLGLGELTSRSAVPVEPGEAETSAVIDEVNSIVERRWQKEGSDAQVR